MGRRICQPHAGVSTGVYIRENPLGGGKPIPDEVIDYSEFFILNFLCGEEISNLKDWGGRGWWLIVITLMVGKIRA